mgnify:CR=1 FL=1
MKQETLMKNINELLEIMLGMLRNIIKQSSLFHIATRHCMST